jgi:hypothetical protein
MSVPANAGGLSTPSPQQARLAAHEGQFREDLENKHGKAIPISTETFHPADILKQMAPVAYEAALADFVDDRVGSALDRACHDFPTPVASCLQRALHGTHDPVTRILLLRDACQAFINTLMAIVVGECMHRGVKLADLEIIVGKSPTPKKPLMSHLRSDRMADRLAAIRSILSWGNANAAPMKCVQFLPVSVIERLQSVHYVRDEISHSETPSPSEAPGIAAAMREELIDVVLDLDNLTQFELVRFQSLEPGNTAHVEVLYGYGARWMETRGLSTQGVAKYTTLAGRDYLLIHCDGEYFDAAPYLFSRQDAKGDHTEVLVLKGYKEMPSPTLVYDVSGQRTTVALAEGGQYPTTTGLAALFDAAK